jgi:hypothetical protein
MGGINLYDALTVASRRLNGCCAKTLNKEIGDRPKVKHVTVEAANAMLTVTVDCPVCGTKTVLETDGVQVKVERKPAGAAEAPQTPPAH